jgi:hypothetical protein
MLIKESSLEHWIDRFYGYGSWNSKLWLVGYEEGGGELPEEVAEKLNYFDSIHARADQPVLCDIRELYARVTYRDEGPKGKTYKTLFDYRFASDAMLHGAWKNLIGFAHGYRQEKLPDLLAYQRKTFIGDREAMIQLYPLQARIATPGITAGTRFPDRFNTFVNGSATNSMFFRTVLTRF